MKKKILTILTTILTLCMCMFILTACGGNDTPPHTHVYNQQVVSDTFKASDATCEDKATYYLSCTCGAKGNETFENGEALGHSFTNYVYNDDAECEKDGTETAICDNGCGEKDTRTKADTALAHTFGAPTYVWNENKCTATRVCGRDSAHIETETVEGLFIKDTDATCLMPAKGHYIATFENPVFKTQITAQNTATNGTELGHDFNQWVSNNNGTHTRTCKRNSNHVETVDCGGGTATCIAYARCVDCDAEYGSLKQHTAKSTWETTAKEHYHACSTVGCTERISSGEHTFDKNKKCTVCEYVTTALLGTEISSDVYTINGTNLYVKVPNNQETFYFGDTINVAEGATYGFYTHIQGTGYIGSFLITIAEEDNVFYLIVKNGNDIPKTYTVTIYRRPIYEVVFDSNGGTAVATQYIEEDCWIKNVSTTRQGYIFDGWDYDFGNAITSDVYATASWSPRTDTKYKVEYYLQNIDDDGYSIDKTKTENLTGTTDKAIAITRSLEYFTLNTELSVLDGVIVPDGSLVLKAYFYRNSYNVVINNSDTTSGTITDKSGNYRYNKSIALIATPKVGYEFVGWYEGNTCLSNELAYVHYANKTTVITAKWVPKTDTKYVIEYYLQNIDNDEYKLDVNRTENLKGITGDLVSVTKTIAHFTLNEDLGVVSATIAPDGSLVLKAYYTRNSYNINVSAENTNFGSVIGSGNYRYDKEITIKANTNIGYDFIGWYNGETKVSDAETYTFKLLAETTLVAKWAPKTDTKYVIEYYLQNIDDNEYKLDANRTENLKGVTGEIVTVTKGITHFTLNEDLGVLSGTIAPDGSLVLKAYYTRNSYKVKTEGNNSKAGTYTEINDTYKFDKEVTLTATPNVGYTFLGWYDGEDLVNENATFTYYISKNVTITAKWQANTDTKYVIEYYLQNLDNDNYTLVETEQLKGETDIIITIQPKDIEHFTFNNVHAENVLSGNINGDGSLVLKAYYTRDTYTVSVNNSTMGSITNAGTYKYGKNITAKATVNNMYRFIGWYNGETLLSNDLTYTFNIESNVVATFGDLEEMAIFNYTISGKSITITGLKDKTQTEIVIPDYVTVIKEKAFKDCSSLKSVVIGDSVTSIGEYAFSNCSSLTKVNYTGTIDQWAQIKFDGYYANPLYYGRNLYITDELVTEANITTATKINSYAFYNCSSLISVVIGNSVTSIGIAAFQVCSSLTSVEIPDSVTSIDSYVFDGCKSLTSVVIGENVTSIGYEAFENCSSLTSIVIPDSVTSIDYYAFDGCSSLTSIVIPDSVTSIGNHAFDFCSSLTSVTIGNSVTSIGKGAFRYCSKLTSIVIPDSVTSIGEDAFFKCSSLTSVYYTGTVEDWDKISIANNNSSLTNANRYYYIENESDLPNDNGNYWHYVDGVPTIWSKTED